MAQPYWNAELETMPWAEMEAWQAQRIAEFVALLRAAAHQTQKADRVEHLGGGSTRSAYSSPGLRIRRLPFV